LTTLSRSPFLTASNKSRANEEWATTGRDPDKDDVATTALAGAADFYYYVSLRVIVSWFDCKNSVGYCLSYY
jgi:hypothetical protein